MNATLPSCFIIAGGIVVLISKGRKTTIFGWTLLGAGVVIAAIALVI
jgi:hypothetical protein